MVDYHSPSLPYLSAKQGLHCMWRMMLESDGSFGDGLNLCSITNLNSS